MHATDLRALVVPRAEAREPQVELKLPRRWVTRLLLPLLLLGGFGALLLWASWETLFPRQPVRVAPVLIKTSVIETTGAELFKANGWIEPRPYPVEVTAQLTGMARIKALYVKPGQRVRAGQVLAELDDAAAQLDLQAAQRKHERKQAAVHSAQAEVAKAETALQNAERTIGLAREENAAEAASAEADLTKARAQVVSSKLTLQIEEELYRNRVVTSDIKVQQARKLVEVAEAEVAIMQARLAKTKTAGQVKVSLAVSQRDAAQAELTSMKAKGQEAQHEAAEAEVEVARARLEVERTVIRAPIHGIIMALHARQGSMLGGTALNAEMSTGLLTLYDPLQLQVRVEVPNNKFALVRFGQPAIVEVEDVLPGRRLPGVVLYDTHQANIARNSVPVKVALPEPVPMPVLAWGLRTPVSGLLLGWNMRAQGLEKLRPEMIASVRFLAPPTKQTAAGGPVRRLYIPRRLVRGEGSEAQVWIVNPMTSRAEPRQITIVANLPGDWVEVKEGLQATDKVIASGTEGLQPGSRVEIVGGE